MSTRIYKITTPGNINRLVEAGTRAQALWHVANSMLQIEVADGKDIAKLVSGGVKVETAGAQPNE